jgi:hypothetical protein
MDNQASLTCVPHFAQIQLVRNFQHHHCLHASAPAIEPFAGQPVGASGQASIWCELQEMNFVMLLLFHMNDGGAVM